MTQSPPAPEKQQDELRDGHSTSGQSGALPTETPFTDARMFQAQREPGEAYIAVISRQDACDLERRLAAAVDERDETKHLLAACQEGYDHQYQRASRAAPSGWVSVPPNPTHSMLMAAAKAVDERLSTIMLDVAYRAMLSALPNPPAAEEK